MTCTPLGTPWMCIDYVFVFFFSHSTDSNGPLTPPNTTRMRLSRKRTVSTLSDDEEEDTKRQRLTRSISFAERSSGLNESFHGDPFSIMVSSRVLLLKLCKL